MCITIAATIEKLIGAEVINTKVDTSTATET